MDEIGKLIFRLKKIGIETVVHANYPWIYLVEVNDKVVGHKFQSEHSFVLGWISVVTPFGDIQTKLSDIKEIFKVIRKYK